MSIVLTPEGTPASPVEGELYYDSTAKGAKLRIENEFKDVGTAFLQGEPHIIPGVLYPAISGKLLDGTTSHSGNYGTAQSDGRSYYYTDIKGSKSIKDPRIGGHFGSQRHKFKSTQLLEQETATHGQNVYSIDGRECARATAPSGKITHWNRYDGNWFRVHQSTDAFYEVVGYFSAVNILGSQWTGSVRDLSISIDGSVTNANFQEMSTSVKSPLADHDGSSGRYVDASSVFSVATGLTLGIHTIKIAPQSSSDYADIFGIELITQDTTSTANRSKIQIPSQNVVSYGKKFTVSGTPHYDPFSSKTDGSAWTSPTSGYNNANSSASWPTNIDTATSLGLDKWVNGSNYYRPYNGMRVIKWVDENGTIKTSVTCMPPNAKSIGDSSSLTNGTAKTNASASNDTFYPTFEAHTTDVNEDNLHEVAKTFHVKEFGNGSANGGTNSSNYPDASMLSGSADDIAYVMDDGCTSLSGTNGGTSNNSGLNGIVHYDSDYAYFTFIGTGVSITGVDWSGSSIYNFVIAQNLPYGSHVYKMDRNTSSTTKHFIDGVELSSVSQGSGHMISEITFHQCKRPPIPEEAVIISDYCLMADFVPVTATGIDKISKGVRSQSVSRDVFFDSSNGAFEFDYDSTYEHGMRVYLTSGASSNTSTKFRIPSFGTNFVHRGFNSINRSNLYIGDTEETSTTYAGTAEGCFQHLTSNKVLGVYNFGNNNISGQNGITSAYEIATPIHTSHHYQSFETPFLHELVGGDRNMEQTNLVCTPDGKTWDEVTRDTSYLSAVKVSAGNSTQQMAMSHVGIGDDFRGLEDNKNLYTKDFAIAFDRFICLKNGTYMVLIGTHKNDSIGTSEYHKILVNGNSVAIYYAHDTNEASGLSFHIAVELKRGDYIQHQGNKFATQNYRLQITKM